MSERLLSIPDACLKALAAIEADPLDLPPEVEAHLRGCPACREARVQWLALEEAPAVLVPAGYFERLPDRVLRKLPARRSNGRHHAPLWMAAAGLALALGIGGYLVGRVQRAPLVEAQIPAEPAEFMAEVLFEDPDEAMDQFATLSPEEAEAVLQSLDSSEPPRP